MSSNQDGTGRGFNADVYSNMAAFDQLPRVVRETLAASDHNWSARQALQALRGKGVQKRGAVRNGIKNAADLAAFIRRADVNKHLVDSAQGIVCTRYTKEGGNHAG